MAEESIKSERIFTLTKQLYYLFLQICHATFLFLIHYFTFLIPKNPAAAAYRLQGFCGVVSLRAEHYGIQKMQ